MDFVSRDVFHQRPRLRSLAAFGLGDQIVLLTDPDR